MKTSLGDVGPRKLMSFMPYIGQKSLWTMKRGFAAVLTACACLSFAAPVAAQESTKAVSYTHLTLPTILLV